jgi:Potential Queuosine, Q, salvage protein family
MSGSASKSVPDQVREACAWVAARARSVRIEESTISEYAAELASSCPPAGPVAAGPLDDGRIAFVLCLDAINFGSGWWPTFRKRPGKSGFGTVEAGITEHFREQGAWSAEELAQLTGADLAATLGQDAGHPLMGDFAASLRDVGDHLLAEHDGSFAALVSAADGSAAGLVELLASWAAFADVSVYDGREVPFFKRAQIAAADLDRAGLASFSDLGQLTAFADNLVPHVLRVDGILTLSSELTEAIETGELLSHGSPPEVELRACAVQAVELLAAGRRKAGAGSPLTPAEIDAVLWNRGGEPRYKSVPRPRSRNTAY